MAKNLVRVLPTDEEAFEEIMDRKAVEARRAQFAKPAKSVEWAKRNRVDDESIAAVFVGANQDLLMSLSFESRLTWIKREVRLYQARKAAA